MYNSMRSSLWGRPLQSPAKKLPFAILRKSSQFTHAQQRASVCRQHKKRRLSPDIPTITAGCPFVSSARQQPDERKQTTKLQASSGYGAEDLEARRRNRLPPTLWMRILAAFFYVVPWLDILSLGWEYHRRFPTSILFLTAVDQLIGVYYSSQFAPLIIFFLLFLSVVKNFKIHHFTRFHCMQSIVLDIVTMLFTLVRTYFPGEIRWSPVMNWFDMYAYNMCMCTIFYCIACALLGHYANVTFVSESTYMQVEEG